MQDVDIHGGLEDARALLEDLRDKNIEMVTDYQSVPTIRCHPSALNQIWINLLQNARQAFDEEGGTIRVCTRADSGRIVVTVADDGCGIPDKNLARALDPGFTTKGVGVGTGLGLAICYQIARDHGGDLNLKSTRGQGTTVTVTLRDRREPQRAPRVA